MTAHQYAEVVKNPNTYRRLYDQNTAALAQPQGQMESLRQHVRELESELTAHRAGEPLAIFREAMTMLTYMVSGTRKEGRDRREPAIRRN